MQVIEELRLDGHSLEYLLKKIKMARSVFYYHRKRITQSDGFYEVRSSIIRIYQQSNGRYGYRRICYTLQNEGLAINHKSVQKLMIQLNLKAKRKKRHYRSYKGEVGRIAPNVIDRNFSVDLPNKKWATDVTQVNIGDIKMYLSPILNMYNGEIISYTISRCPNLKMVIDMLKKACRKNKNMSGLILHSDQGWHYQHKSYQKILKEKDIIQSISRKGNCLDNAMMENFFGLMKNELLYINKFDSIDNFEKELIKYIW